MLACALTAQADAIVSGDDDLLTLKAYQGIPILTAVQALGAHAVRKLIAWNVMTLDGYFEGLESGDASVSLAAFIPQRYF